MYTSTIRRVAVVAAATCATFGVLTGSAFADKEDPALEALLDEPAAVAPGGVGELHFTVRNVSKEATEGILLNVSLPPYVSLDMDNRCQATGENDEGGTLLSCNFADPLRGQIEPGETYEARTPFNVAADAPADSELGELGALVVPLENGEATEDWTDLDGDNVAWTTITTSSGGAWASLLSWFS